VTAKDGLGSFTGHRIYISFEFPNIITSLTCENSRSSSLTRAWSEEGRLISQVEDNEEMFLFFSKLKQL